MKKIILILLAVGIVIARTTDPNETLNNVRNKFNKVEDYSVNATITVDVSFLTVPETHATVYFKQPDKIKLDSEGFALLPKQGLSFSPSQLLEGDHTAIYVRDDTLENFDVEIIKVIPNSDTTGIVLSTLWIDKEDYVIRKIETTTKNQGTVTLNLDYENNIEYALPSQIKFTFKVEDMQLPHGMPGETDQSESRRRNRNQPMTGTVIIEYDNYKINLGLDDSFFEETIEEN